MHRELHGFTFRIRPQHPDLSVPFIPDLISIEILQKGEAKAPAEPWASMKNTGVW